MIDYRLILVDSAVLCGVIGALVGLSFRLGPRIWLRSLPKDIQELAEPMTSAERRWAAIMGLLIVGSLFSGLVMSTVRFGSGHGFLPAILHAYLVFQAFNLFDLLVLDWGMMQLIDPTKPPIAGTENARGYRDFGFHAGKSLKGVMLGIPFSAVAVAVAWLVPS
ncbi:MAG: hypothetical protein AAGN66_18140 [Acidobacteriota bacterium]